MVVAAHEPTREYIHPDHLELKLCEVGRFFLKLILEGKESAPPYKFCAGEKGLLVFNPEQGNFTTRVSIFHAA